MKSNKNSMQKIMLVLMILLATNLECAYASIEVTPSILEFNNPSEQKIIITNNSPNEAKLNSIFFTGTQITSMPILQSVSTNGFEGCSVIPSGGSCVFFVKAAEDASATTDSKGTMFAFNYTLGDVEVDNASANFAVKINYNSDLKFELGDPIYTGKEAENMLLGDHAFDVENHHDEDLLAAMGFIQKLRIINSNPKHAVKIKEILLPERMFNAKVLDYTRCASLDSHASCEVDIVRNSTSDVFPVYVKYDVDGKEGILAAVKITPPESSVIWQSTRAFAAGAGFAGIILYSYGSEGYSRYIGNAFKYVYDKCIGKAFKKYVHDKGIYSFVDNKIISTSTLEKPFKLLPDGFIGGKFAGKVSKSLNPIAQLTDGYTSGYGYYVVDKAESALGGHSSNDWIKTYVNKFFLIAGMSVFLGYKECRDREKKAICMMWVMAANSIPSLGWDAFVDLFFSENGWLNNIVTNFGAKAALRVPLKYALGFDQSGVQEIVADTVSGGVLYGIEGFLNFTYNLFFDANAQIPELEVKKNVTINNAISAPKKVD